MKKLVFGLFFLCLVACERSIDWQPESTSTSFIVIEGGITDEARPHQIKLTRTASSINAVPLPVTGAELTITDGTNYFPLTEDAFNPGTYYTASEVVGQAGKTYTLTANCSDTILTASDMMWSVAGFAPLQYEKSEEMNAYRITWVANTYHPNTASMYEIVVDWSTLPAYADAAPEDCRAVLYYYTLTTIDVSNLFSPAIEKLYFPEGTIITEKKYSLSPAHEEFIRCLLLETSWRGGLWDAIPGNLPGNVSKPGIGFFSASSVKQAMYIVGP